MDSVRYPMRCIIRYFLHVPVTYSSTVSYCNHISIPFPPYDHGDFSDGEWGAVGCGRVGQLSFLTKPHVSHRIGLWRGIGGLRPAV